MARFIVDVLAGKMGADILLLDLSELTLIADYFVITTGETDRQIQAMTEDVLQQLEEKHQVKCLRVEGAPESGWVLMDYGSVVVHLFSEAQRSYYQLEQLWKDAHTVVRMA